MTETTDNTTEENLFALSYRRNLQYETGTNGNIVLLIPKFRNAFMVQWLVPLLKKKNFRVKLDERGSFIWNNCDGNTSLIEIAEKMRVQFNETEDTIYGRIAMFILKMEKDGFVVRVT